jgi:hypothetical protein
MSAAHLGSNGETIGPALLVLALAGLMSVVFPLIDSHTQYRHPVAEGDLAELADGITLVPTAGWDLASGPLVGDTRSPVGSTATTHRYAVTTRQGVAGVAEDFVGPTRQGSVVAFVFGSPSTSSGAQGQSSSEGMEIVVSGPEPDGHHRKDIVAMIDQLTQRRSPRSTWC